MKIHSKGITTKGDVDFEAMAKVCEEFNGADLRNVLTEGGMFAIREDREYVIEEDLMKAARKIRETKKLESKLDYSKVWFEWIWIGPDSFGELFILINEYKNQT